jgi:hypothetical protein
LLKSDKIVEHRRYLGWHGREHPAADARGLWTDYDGRRLDERPMRLIRTEFTLGDYSENRDFCTCASYGHHRPACSFV